MLIKCRFLDENKAPKGREYIYATNDEVAEGEIVVTQERKEIVVTSIDIPPEAASAFGKKLKYVSKTQNTQETPIHEIIEAEATEIMEIQLPEITVDKDNLAIVEQLPIITGKLKVVSGEVDSIVSAVLLMECTEKNRQAVKKARAKLNALLTGFEKCKITVKGQVLQPYEEFNADYKFYVSDKIKTALQVLDERIKAIEDDLKQELQNGAESYFYEYSAFVNIDWLTWEQSGISVGLSDNKTGLSKKVKAFIDKVVDDMALIDTQDYKLEIMVEYRKELNVARSISTVKARFKAVEEQKRIQAEAEERKKRQEEQRRLQAEALEKARQEYIQANQQQAPLFVEQAKPATPLKPPMQTPFDAPAEHPKPEAPTTKKYSVAFKVCNETVERIAACKKFLVDNGYEYMQVPLKNIREEN